MTKKENPFKKNKYEILYNIINSTIAGGLVFLGSFSNGSLTKAGLAFAVAAFLIVFLTKFKNYWDGEKGEYSVKLFNFVPI